MNIIIETDIGHDPDDFFAICYLIAAGVNISAIIVHPGDPDQIAIVKLICKVCQINPLIGYSKEGRFKLTSGKVHHELLKKYNHDLYAKADDYGANIIESIKDDWTGFIIGPPTTFGIWSQSYQDSNKKILMQGGFLPYSMNPYNLVKLDKFIDKDSMQTFNMNGDKFATEQIINNSSLDRSFVGKHVCHTVVFNKKIISKYFKKNYDNQASKLFMEAANLYFNKRDEKKFHDPTAAICLLHPEICWWVKGKHICKDNKWTTIDGQDNIAAMIDYDRLWSHIGNFT